ncbi:hypothetical protein G7939_17790 [Ralstonia solanacearum]|uniref:hypothetical protein n=1 Tax=Ralstonia pseudosolanacearum TaxID=1310165 RepID=UPI00125F4F48|nr:hypothetical protein [Ralstonia pseudosolanacearum]MCK4118207.1 hypothetical protein [Ralstonia pseudosolanacearum]QIK25115.1 hypothetical protein G7939_17790 [Ralstonia solanacearum]QIK26849.1 hypothetical protein G7947_00030 [Ralstonia solanacearum]QIK31754.1 hypothetical protein G7969_00030 [Ralstonia solanacearum]
MRAKWFPLKLGISETLLARRLREMPFTPGDGSFSKGFRLEKATRGKIAGQYIEQRVVDRMVSLPDGSEIQQELVEVTVTDFRIDSDRALGLEVRNGPRNLLPFFSAVSSVSGFAVTVSSRVTVDLREAANEFARRINVPTRVSALECSGIQLDGGVAASFKLSGGKNVLQTFDELPFSSRKSSIDSLRIDFTLEGVGCSVHLSKAAAAKIRAADGELVADCVCKAFERALAS